MVEELAVLRHLGGWMILENELEGQQQYSRRTRIHFNKVRLPTTENVKVIFHVDTDNLVPNICYQNLEKKHQFGRHWPDTYN